MSMKMINIDLLKPIGIHNEDGTLLDRFETQNNGVCDEELDLVHLVLNDEQEFEVCNNGVITFQFRFFFHHNPICMLCFNIEIFVQSIVSFIKIQFFFNIKFVQNDCCMRKCVLKLICIQMF